MFEDLLCASRRFWRGKGTQLITNYQEFADKKKVNVEKSGRGSENCNETKREGDETKTKAPPSSSIFPLYTQKPILDIIC